MPASIESVIDGRVFRHLGRFGWALGITALLAAGACRDDTGTGPARVASITIAAANGASTTVVGQALQLSATTKDDAGRPISVRPVSWRSDNIVVASVDSTGLVRGVSPGTVTITATSDGISASLPLTIRPAPVAALTITAAGGETTIAAGQTLQLAAVPKDASGSALSGRVISWSSGNASLASVSPAGLVA
ncbi:MAG: Ig-like domain-containing protein, partial [bacterium]